MSSQIDMIRREIGRAQTATRSAFRAVLKSLALATRVQRVTGQGLAGEELEDMELFQHFGFTSAPPSGSDYIPLPLGGRTSASVVIATEHGDFRFVLDSQGESCVYNQWGDFAHFKKDRSIHVKAAEKVFAETKVFRVEASQRIELVSPTIVLEASNKITGTTPITELSNNLSIANLTTTQNLTMGVGGVANMSNGTVNFSTMKFTYTDSLLNLTGGSIKHNGNNIGGDHHHDRVAAGSDFSGGPS